MSHLASLCVAVFMCFECACSMPSSMMRRESKASKHSVEAAPEVSSITPIKGIMPVQYVHIPKAGSSFATSLVHSFCPGLLESVTVQDPSELDKTCTENRTAFARFSNGHFPYTASLGPLEHVVTMVRSPKQRIISGYHHGLHDCTSMQTKYHIEQNKDHPSWDETLVKEYAQCVQGCASNMITGNECSASGSDTRVGEATSAISKLGFVGLTEHWALSVCLWHARFGSKCLRSEFTNTRPGTARGNGNEYDESVFGTWTPHDQALYEAAKNYFFSELQRYGVNQETCAKRICNDVADVYGLVNLESADTLKGPSSFAKCDSLESCHWEGEPIFDEN